LLQSLRPVIVCRHCIFCIPFWDILVFQKPVQFLFRTLKLLICTEPFFVCFFHQLFTCLSNTTAAAVCLMCLWWRAAEKTDIMGRYAARADNTRLRQMHPHWLKHRRGPDDASLLRMDSALLDTTPPDQLAMQVRPIFCCQLSTVSCHVPLCHALMMLFFPEQMPPCLTSWLSRAELRSLVCCCLCLHVVPRCE